MRYKEAFASEGLLCKTLWVETADDGDAGMTAIFLCEDTIIPLPHFQGLCFLRKYVFEVKLPLLIISVL